MGDVVEGPWSTQPAESTETEGALARAPEPEETAESAPRWVPSERGDQADEHTEGPADSSQGTELAPRPDTLPQRRAGRIPPALRATATRAGQATREGARRSGPVARQAYQHSACVRDGAGHVLRAGWRRVMLSDLAEAVREAKNAGDLSTAAELEHRRREAANDRAKRVAEMVKLTGKLLIAGTGAWVGLTTIVAVAGVVTQLVPDGPGWKDVWTEGYWAAHVATAEWTLWLVSLWPYLGGAALVSTVYALWRTGQSLGGGTTWAAPQQGAAAVDEVHVTADRLVTALKHCGIPELKKAIKEGETAGMVDLISQHGPGVATTITLPRGIPASALAERVQSVASSLSRAPHEVALAAAPDNASRVHLWVARPGALDEAVPPSPLSEEDYGPVDLYRDPVPWGLSLQGDPIEMDLIQRHILIAGLSKQGKTASARALALHAALDPSVELRIADLKGAGDWSMFDGLASTLIEGAGDEQELATADMVEAACTEMDRRLAARRAKGSKGDITSKEAKDGSGDHHPLIVIVDEVQVAYMSLAAEPEVDADGNEKDGKRPVGGQKNSSRLWQAAKRLHDQGRAVNVMLWQFAQNPTDRNLPAIVREGAHVRGCLYVSSPSIARKAIGDAPVDRGAAPHRLRSEIDAGTVVTAGATEIVRARGDMANTVRTHFLDTEPAHAVADRARQLRAAPAEADQAEPEQRDLLDDLDQVLGSERVGITDVVSLLRDLAPHWQPYERLNGKQLKSQLKALGVQVPGPKGYPQIVPENVRDALAERRAKNDGQEESEVE